MRQFNVDIFNRSLGFVGHTIIDVRSIDDDYIAAKANTIEFKTIPNVITNGDFIRLENDFISFFGVVTDVSPGKELTTLQFKPFISVFDELFLFDTKNQNTDATVSHRTLEETIRYYVNSLYINNADTLQNLPLSISIDPTITQTKNWSLNITPDVEGSHYSIIHLYSVLIVNALKKYGVVIHVAPNFSSRTIHLTITKQFQEFKIDANLEDVFVKTLKYNDRPTGTNKLVVYDDQDYSQTITFYVYTDRSWGVDNVDRITPVVLETRSVTRDEEFEDPVEGFAASALDLAYSTLSGLQWDNLIELEASPVNKNIEPTQILIGQTVSIWYKGGKYTSILTGKIISPNSITLLFGSERIEYSKRLRL